MKTTTRSYRQGRRAEAAQERTEAILAAAVELFVERPLEQITLADVAERAGVGVQTLIRRVQTKDGLIRACNAYVAERIGEARGEPDCSDPDAVAGRLLAQYESFGRVIQRGLQQEESSPGLAEMANAGRIAHAAWIDTAFADAIAARGPLLRAQLIGVTGVELWLVLRNDAGLSPEDTRAAVADLIRRALT
jgi:AcrR family transcriptional regulator